MKTLVFDLGGVILPLDMSLWKTAFDNFKPGLYEAAWTSNKDFFDDFERGKYSNEHFMEVLRKDTGAQNDDLLQAWNALFLQIPEDNLKLLQELKSSYNLFLLSNTNALHYDFILNHLSELGFPNYGDVFEHQFLSYEIGMRKPDQEIYQHVQSELGLSSSDFVFIEDTEENQQAAREAGWRVHTHVRNSNLRQSMQALLTSIE